MARLIRNRNLFFSDVLIIILSVYISFVLRAERLELGIYWPAFFLITGLALLIFPVVFKRAGIYARYWQYASVDALLPLFSSIVISAGLTIVLTIIALVLWPDIFLMPRSVLLIFLALALLGIPSPRIGARMAIHYQYQLRYGNKDSLAPVVVMGAGSAGSMIYREIRRNPQLGLRVIGFVDDDPMKRKMIIHGLPVLGNKYDIPRLVQEHSVGQVIIAMPTAPGRVIREVVNICEECFVRVKIIPGIYELLNGKVSVNQLRNVEIEDLLRREPIKTDLESVGALIKGKKVLVTGGGGSIGSELCRQILKSEPSELIVLGHGENSIFAVENELQKLFLTGSLISGESFPKSRLKTVIADIRFLNRIQSIFEEYRPDIVFHTAAHKHLPLMELNPIEAVSNNVLGTRNLVDTALAMGIERFVMISTDKAVNPSSIMGATKRVAELLVNQAALISGKAFVAVRFGNVLGSRGSVVLTFKEQIAAGGPVTVTHPDMERYFMTIPEAVQLVLQASALGKGGEVFVLDMGDPVRIADLASDLIKLSGLQPGQDIDIIYTGIRKGEKLQEELFVDEENFHRTIHEKIFIANKSNNDVYVCWEEEMESLGAAVQNNDSAAVISGLQRLIPGFRS
jgi:FlaA1/EpsC-like NDP-sugar epimerase